MQSNESLLRQYARAIAQYSGVSPKQRRRLRKRIRQRIRQGTLKLKKPSLKEKLRGTNQIS
jgi:ribosomal protein L10